MTRPIRSVAVLGAGVMGAGIAAHAANAGIPVLLLDIVPPSGGPDRNAFAAGGLQKALKAKPAAFFHPGNARLVAVGNLEDDLARAGQCDLVIEAVVEKLAMKQALFERLEAVRQPHCVIASNTSGLRIADMMAGRGEAFRQSFLVTHFFNPPRYMKLLELVAGVDTDPAVLARVRAFGEEVLGKGIVVAKDSPNFIANRIGAHSMMFTIHQMLADGLSPEDVDAITGVAMAHPKSASFRTADVVGLDTFVHVADNCHATLEADEEREVFKVPAYIRAMYDRKLLGDKTGGGFYRKGKGGLETLDPKTGEYRAHGASEAVAKATKAAARAEAPANRVRALCAAPGVAGEFAWKVLSHSLAYAARRIGEITDDVVAIDEGMRWGYNWELGPFETWDALGFTATVNRMDKDGVALPASVRKMRDSGATGFYRADGSVYDLLAGEYQPRTVDPRRAPLETVRRGGAPVLKNNGAQAWDLGDGVLGVTFTTKANSIDPDVIGMLGQAIERAEQDFRAMVVFNRGEHFCVGANLFLVVMAAGQKDWESIRRMVRAYQGAVQRLTYASVPVVAAPYSVTVGGGLELCFGASAVQAAAETYAGLVEVGVGLIPGGAGTMNMLWRALEGVPEGTQHDVYASVTQVFKNIALAKVATSAAEGQALGYFRATDGVTFDQARLLHDAKARAIGLAEAGYHRPVPRAYRLPGDSGIATLKMLINTLRAGGYASDHDTVVAGKLATVLCGGAGGASREVTEAEILELECEAFVSLCGEAKSQERMQYMLMNNKPLRN